MKDSGLILSSMAKECSIIVILAEIITKDSIVHSISKNMISICITSRKGHLKFGKGIKEISRMASLMDWAKSVLLMEICLLVILKKGKLRAGECITRVIRNQLLEDGRKAK